MTNPSMPGLLKVGMTKKVPTHRALDKDLNTAGVPTPFQTQYYAFFDNMIFAEQQAHKKLQQFYHGKEFFKTDVPTAICAIESINIPFTKLYSKPEDDAKIAKIRAAKEAEQRKQEEARRLKKQYDELEKEAQRLKKLSDESLQKQIVEEQQKYEKIEAAIDEQRYKIEKKYEDLIKIKFVEPSFWLCWPLITIIVWVIFIFIVIEKFSGIIPITDTRTFFIIIIPAALFAYFLKNYIKYRQKNSSKCKSLIRQRDDEIESMCNSYMTGKAIINCPDCHKKLRVPINKKLFVHCPECDLKFKIVT